MAFGLRNPQVLLPGCLVVCLPAWGADGARAASSTGSLVVSLCGRAGYLYWMAGVESLEDLALVESERHCPSYCTLTMVLRPTGVLFGTGPQLVGGKVSAH